MDSKIGFESTMFVYAAESAEYPSTLKVMVPEAFLIDKNEVLSDIKLHKGNNNIFINAIAPALSNTTTKYNYINLPVISYGTSRFNKGDRLITQFINNNPQYGVILGRY